MDKEEGSFNYSSIPASSSFPSQKELKKKQSLCSSSGYSSFPSNKPLHAWNSLDSEDKNLIGDDNDGSVDSTDIATCSTVDEDSAATLATVESTFEADSTSSSENDSDVDTITSAFGSEDEACAVTEASASGSHSSQVPNMNLAQYTNEILWHFLNLERYNPSGLVKKGTASSAAKSDSEAMLVPPSSPTPAEHEIELADNPPTQSTHPAEAEITEATDVKIKMAKRKHRHHKKRRRLRWLLSSSLNLFHRCFRSPKTNRR